MINYHLHDNMDEMYTYMDYIQYCVDIIINNT